MTRLRRSLPVFALLLLALPVFALPRTTAELEKNIAKLQKIREEDRDKLNYLYKQAHAFLALSPERAEQLRQLDQDLHQLPWAYKKHLKQIMKKYVVWLGQLPPEQRQQIEKAASKEAKLTLIQQICEQQWTAALPKAEREKLEELSGEERKQEIVRLKKQQHKWEVEWRVAMNNWEAVSFRFKKSSQQLPEYFTNLQSESRLYTELYLKQLVPTERWQELEKAQGQWPWFPYLLVKLADEYPLALPSETKWPQRIQDLPDEIKTRLKKANVDFDKTLKPLEGKWPEFAQKVAGLTERLAKYELWPTKFADLSPPVRDFIEKELKPVLIDKDLHTLAQAEHSWPHYPETIQKLARKYFLTVPWQSLPGLPAQPNFWDNYRLTKGLSSDLGQAPSPNK